MGRRNPKIDYPLLVASIYIGVGAGTFGFSAYEPSAVSHAGHFLEGTIGLIPLALTSFSKMTLAGFLLGTATVTLVIGRICPGEKEAIPMKPELNLGLEEEDQAEKAFRSKPEEQFNLKKIPWGMWLEYSHWPNWLISIMGFSFVCYWFITRGFDLNLNIMNFIILSLAFPLHGTPLGFWKSMERSARVASGIFIQFPFYAGIQGMLASSGLAVILLKWITSAANSATLPLFVFFNAALVNFFLPISEGAWEIQGAWVVKTAQNLNAGIPQAINGFTAGEIIGKVIQPFWAIPILGICSIAWRDIMGYCLIAFAVLSLIWIGCLCFLPL